MGVPHQAFNRSGLKSASDGVSGEEDVEVCRPDVGELPVPVAVREGVQVVPSWLIQAPELSLASGVIQ